MKSVRGFLTAMPLLCKCKNAARKTEVIGDIFDKELKGHTVFERNDDDRKDPINRSEIVFSMIRGDLFADPKSLEQCERLAHIIEWQHYIDKHGEADYLPMVEAEYVAAKQNEQFLPEIAAVMTADEAVAARWE